MYIKPISRLQVIDTEEAVQQYIVDKEETYRRATVKAAALTQTGEMVTYALASIPRIYHTHVNDSNSVRSIDPVGANTHELVAYIPFRDDRENYRNIETAVVLGPILNTVSVVTDAVLFAYTESPEGPVPVYTYNTYTVAVTAAANFYRDHSVTYVDANLSSAPTNTTQTHKILASEGYRLYGHVIADKALPGLESNVHRHVNYHYIAPGETIIDSDLQSLYDGFYALRTRGLKPMFSWAGIGERPFEVANAGAGNADCITISSNAYVNLFDFVSTARTSNTPGFSCPAYRAGIGNPETTDGRKVKVACWAYAYFHNMAGSANYVGNAFVKFQGPDSFTNNFCEIPILSNVIDQWQLVGNTDYCVYLDSNIDASENSVNRNKIDAYVKTPAYELAGLHIGMSDVSIRTVQGQMITDYEGY